MSYALGFYVEEKALDGKLHDVSVKLAKKLELNGASLRYRKRYLALNPKSPAFSATPPGDEGISGRPV